MRKQYKRVLAYAMAAILIWNTCGWQAPALAASVTYGRKGIMYAGQKTPDGYYVDKDGAWDGKEK